MECPISIGEALLDSGVDSLNETLWPLSSSLSWLRDSPQSRFLQRGASVVLSVGGWRLRGEVRQGNLEGQAPLHKAIFLPPIPFFTSLG